LLAKRRQQFVIAKTPSRS